MTLTEMTGSFIRVIKTYFKFIGPGLMVLVAYMDPGNYSTAVAAGLKYKYDLLFSIFILNILAIFLQILAARLGCVTGLDLAANCKQHFNKRTNLILYLLTEIAIIATDLAEVVGTAIALQILFKLPLIIGVLITIIDVLIVLMAYRPSGPLLFIRLFELFVTILVLLTVLCFAIELYEVGKDPSFGLSFSQVFSGFLPSPSVIDSSGGLYLSLAILGATVMPHSLYLGLGLVQARLKDFDLKNGYYLESDARSGRVGGESVVGEARSGGVVDGGSVVGGSEIPGPETFSNPKSTNSASTSRGYHPLSSLDLLPDSEVYPMDNDFKPVYRPSIHSINHTMSYTIWELVISLFTVALFVNSAILIVAGATLDSTEYEADLFTIYNLLSTHLSPTAGFVFALALLCLGQSAGVVCTLAGQMVSEGFLNWSLPPVQRRLVTRALAIIPCLIVVTFSGRQGLASILNSSQVVLSLLLPVVTAPLIYFTCSKHIMKVPIHGNMLDDDNSIISDRFISSQPAIRLQDLRNSHPCNFDETDDEESQPLNVSNNYEPSNIDNYQPIHNDLSPVNSQIVTGYKDFSNNIYIAILSILIWGFITCLNMYLIISVFMGYDMPM